MVSMKLLMAKAPPRSRDDVLTLLVRRSFDGEQAAYRELLGRLSEMLRPYIRRQLYRAGRPDHDAEDLVQEALIAIHAKWHTYEREAPIAAWAYAIARYKLIDFLRATARETRYLPLEEIVEIAAGGHESVEPAISARRTMARLPQKQRQAVELVRLKGFSIQEAAAMTGISEAAMKVSVHRGVKAIERSFEEPQ